jgi:hypothetical protein
LLKDTITYFLALLLLPSRCTTCLDSSMPATTSSYVFPAMLNNGNPVLVWSAASHEVGHSLGLYHDQLLSTLPGCSSYQNQSYYDGLANNYYWAPIMGEQRYLMCYVSTAAMTNLQPMMVVWAQPV